MSTQDIETALESKIATANRELLELQQRVTELSGQQSEKRDECDKLSSALAVLRGQTVPKPATTIAFPSANREADVKLKESKRQSVADLLLAEALALGPGKVFGRATLVDLATARHPERYTQIRTGSYNAIPNLVTNGKLRRVPGGLELVPGGSAAKPASAPATEPVKPMPRSAPAQPQPNPATDILAGIKASPFADGNNSSATPLDAQGVIIGQALREPFTLLDLTARLDFTEQHSCETRAGIWLATWKRHGWIDTVSTNLYRRSSKFGG